MKRLVSPVADGGLPYLNSDFGDILQNESLKSYAGHLDAVNDVPLLSTAPMDRGIWLRAPIIVSSTSTTITLDIRNTLCYMPGITQSGDFLEPNPSYLTGSGIITLNTPNSLFYIRASAEYVDNRIFKSAQSQPVITKRYWEYTFAPSLTEPVIKYEGNRTARHYARVLKYKLAQTGEIFTTSNVSLFIGSGGLGVGDMTGFALCNGQNGTLDLRGRFVIGYDPSQPSTPVDNTSVVDVNNLNLLSYDSTDTMNYGAIGNKGGGVKDITNTIYPSHLTQPSQNARHTHGNGYTGTNFENLNHTHDPNGNTSNQGFVYAQNLTSSGSGNSSRSSLENNRSTAATTGGVNSAYNNLTHKHSIEYQPQAGTSRHETRAPYIVLAYYQKI